MKKTKLVALSLVLALILNMMMPLMTVIAASSYTITFEAEDSHTLENDGGHLKIDGQYVDLKDSSNNTIGEVNVSGKSATITVSDGTVGQLNYNSANLFTLYNTDGHVAYNMGTELSSNTVFKVEDYSSETPQVAFEDISVNATFNNTSGEIVFNNGAGRTPEGASYNGTLVKAGNINSSKKNEITINTSFGENIASSVTINGTKYDVNNTESNTFEVDGAESYTIVVDGVEDLNAPRTLIWANPDYVPTDAEDAEWVSQFSIEHGNAKIIAVYDENGNKIDSSEYINTQVQPDGSKSDEYGLRNGFGWVSVKPGYKATFEFYPEYGYQLTSVAINEQPMEASATANQFTVEIPNGNLHFAAKFTKTDDVVKAESDKISGGEISLGNTLAGGTAQLTVNDVELSSDKIKGFENAAGEYTISNYLDIDLYNVYYKGKNDANDVWTNKISELDKEATITLKLADGITADDIVLVHNIHDGEEYEIIEIESYDAETNTITFKTKSFSNYAIATKTASATTEETNTADNTKTTDTSSNPTTGDNIIMIISIFAIATFGVFTTLKVNKNRRIRKH